MDIVKSRFGPRQSWGGHSPLAGEGAHLPVLISSMRRAQSVVYTSSLLLPVRPPSTPPHKVHPQHIIQGPTNITPKHNSAHMKFASSHTMSCLSLVLVSGPSFLLLFCLTTLPFNAFSLFLAFYFGKGLLLGLLWAQHREQRRALITSVHASDLFWISLALVLLPHILPGLAFFLEASALSVLDLSRRIPSYNATAAIGLEFSLRCFQWIIGRNVWVPSQKLLLTVLYCFSSINRRLKKPAAPFRV